MKENKTTMNTEVRQAYEPVKVKVMKVTPQGVLCASGGGIFGTPQKYNGSKF